AASRVLAQLTSGQPAAAADLKALADKASEKLEVTSKSVILAAASFQHLLDQIAKSTAAPVLQPTSVLSAAQENKPEEQDLNAPPRAVRHRLQDERASITHKFGIAGHEGYVTVGLYPNGQPGEIFIKMAKEGSTISGLMDAFATSVSIALQHGVPLKTLCEKFAHTRFEPSGWTGNPQIGYAKSLMDYIFKWLNLRFLSGTQLSLFASLTPHAEQLPAPPTMIPETEDEEDDAMQQGQLAKLAEQVAKRLNQVSAPAADAGLSSPGVSGGGIAPTPQGTPTYDADATGEQSLTDRGIFHAADAMRDMYEMGDAPSCPTCGAIMVRNGSCYRCMSCGSTSGCS
ncbi:MAG TPA: vitamin B12-dependent ribonucleotide reductase, partial [Terracidiphilus sp.]